MNTEEDIPDNKTLKLVVSLSAHQSYDDQFDAPTTEQEREYSNTIVLVTPESGSSVDTNTGIRELARKVVGGELLIQQEEQALPDGFDDVHEQNLRSLHDRVLDKYGEVHVPTERGLFPEGLSADGDDLYEAAREIVSPDSSQLEAKVEENVEQESGGIQYRFLRKDFHRLETLPEGFDEEPTGSATREIPVTGTLDAEGLPDADRQPRTGGECISDDLQCDAHLHRDTPRERRLDDESLVGAVKTNC